MAIRITKNDKKRKWKLIKNISQLIDAIKRDYNEFFIWLGCARSSKTIRYYEAEKLFSIENFIDDTYQELTAEQLFDENETNIGVSINRGCFYMDVY